MNKNRKSFGGKGRQEQGSDHQTIDNHRALIGLIALLGLAFSAVIIRNFFPDLNPLFLAGLGITTYGVYMGALILAHLAQAQTNEASLKTAKVKVDAN